MKKGLNKLFYHSATRSRTYSTTMKLKTHIILSVDLEIWGYEDFFQNTIQPTWLEDQLILLYPYTYNGHKKII